MLRLQSTNAMANTNAMAKFVHVSYNTFFLKNELMVQLQFLFFSFMNQESNIQSTIIFAE